MNARILTGSGIDITDVPILLADDLKRSRIEEHAPVVRRILHCRPQWTDDPRTVGMTLHSAPEQRQDLRILSSAMIGGATISLHHSRQDGLSLHGRYRGSTFRLTSSRDPNLNLSLLDPRVELLRLGFLWAAFLDAARPAGKRCRDIARILNAAWCHDDANRDGPRALYIFEKSPTTPMTAVSFGSGSSPNTTTMTTWHRSLLETLDAESKTVMGIARDDVDETCDGRTATVARYRIGPHPAVTTISPLNPLEMLKNVRDLPTLDMPYTREIESDKDRVEIDGDPYALSSATAGFAL